MLIVEPRPSTRVRVFLVAMYLLAFASLITFLPSPLAAVLCLVGTGALWVEWRRARPPGRLECRAGDEWWVDGDGPWNLRRASVLSAWLVVLDLDDGDRRVRVPLLPDSLPAPQWRRLRATLRQFTGEVAGP